MDNRFYVTTPIYYANSEPHIGTAYTTVAADIIARYYRLLLGSSNVLFQVGTDEHGQKIVEAARKKNRSPKEFLDSLVPTFIKAWKGLNISYDVFLRTTDPRHIKVASNLIQKIYNNGFVYEGLYRGLYCVGCEKYLTEKELIGGKCPLHPNDKPRYQKEKNYFFKLSEFAPKVLKLIENNTVEILPECRRHEIINRIKDGVENLSISRESVSWGIPIPWDKNKKSTIWVWIEALLNYYSVTQFGNNHGKFWPANLHLVGKDILWFHTTIWFSLLLAAELPLPKQVFGHGFFTIDGQKISKSTGNVISPQELVKKYGIDGARYLIISAAPFGEDGDIKKKEFSVKYNADLANGLGNLVARVAKLCEKAEYKNHPNILLFADQVKVFESIYGNKLPGDINNYKEYFDSYRLDKALEVVFSEVSDADLYINQNEPWSLLEKPDKKDELFKILKFLVDKILTVSTLLKPFLPETAEKIEKQFSAEKIKSGVPLFPRLTS